MAVTATAAIAAFAWLLTPQAAPQAPKVIAMTPAPGSQVTAGAVTITITFDQPMQAKSYSFVILDPAIYPDCAREPRQSADKRSFMLECRAESGRSYAIGFNSARFRNFKSAANGMAAQPATLHFTAR